MLQFFKTLYAGHVEGKKSGCALTHRLNMNLKLIPQLIPQEKIGEVFIKILFTG